MHLIMMVLMSDWTWLEEMEEVNPDTGFMEGTGKYIRQYGEFWNFMQEQSNIMTPSFERMIDINPPIYTKDNNEYGLIQVNRNRVSGDLTALEQELINKEVTFEAAVTDNPKQWIVDNNFVKPIVEE